MAVLNLVTTVERVRHTSTVRDDLPELYFSAV